MDDNNQVSNRRFGQFFFLIPENYIFIPFATRFCLFIGCSLGGLVTQERISAIHRPAGQAGGSYDRVRVGTGSKTRIRNGLGFDEYLPGAMRE